MNPITIHMLAEHRSPDHVGDEWNGQDYLDVGLPFIGGCEVCGAAVAAYNSHPSTSGYLRCSTCIGDDGYATVESANAAIFDS